MSKFKSLFLACILCFLFSSSLFANVPCGKAYQQTLREYIARAHSLGLMELEEKGIIEILRDKLTPPDFSDRKANVYRMLGFPGQENRGRH